MQVLLTILQDEKLSESEKLEAFQNIDKNGEFDAQIKRENLLPICARNNYVKIAQWLIEEKGQTKEQWDEILNEAVINGSLDILKYLYEINVSKKLVSKLSKYTSTFLFRAIHYGYVQIVEFLLKNVSECDEHAGQSALRCLTILYEYEAGNTECARISYGSRMHSNRMPTVENMIKIIDLIAPELKYKYQFGCYQKELRKAPMTDGEKIAAMYFVRTAKDIKEILNQVVPDENFPEDVLNEMAAFSMGVDNKDFASLEFEIEVEEKESENSKLQSFDI